MLMNTSEIHLLQKKIGNSLQRRLETASEGCGPGSSCLELRKGETLSTRCWDCVCCQPKGGPSMHELLRPQGRVLFVHAILCLATAHSQCNPNQFLYNQQGTNGTCTDDCSGLRYSVGQECFDCVRNTSSLTPSIMAVFIEFNLA